MSNHRKLLRFICTRNASHRQFRCPVHVKEEWIVAEDGELCNSKFNKTLTEVGEIVPVICNECGAAALVLR